MISPLLDLEAEYFIFPCISFLAGIISALVGFGGGIMMVILLSVFVPINELIAVIGLVQLGSLLSRMYVYHAHIPYSLCIKYLLGAIPGTIVAMLVFDQVPIDVLAIVLGSFLLYSAWKPQGLPIGSSTLGLSFSGSVTAFSSFFVGAPGPALASIMGRFSLPKYQFIASITACMLGLNLMKLSAFYHIGFPMNEWWVICLCMMLTGIGGTFAGGKLMHKVNDKKLFKAVRIAMALAALNLFYKSLSGSL